ncbi:MAG: hypothetical protein ACR2N6_07455 [Miltoncostaeaceae bacterium]
MRRRKAATALATVFVAGGLVFVGAACGDDDSDDIEQEVEQQEDQLDQEEEQIEQDLEAEEEELEGELDAEEEELEQELEEDLAE